MTTSLEELKVMLLIEIEKMKGEIELLLWIERKELATLHPTSNALSLEYRVEK